MALGRETARGTGRGRRGGGSGPMASGARSAGGRGRGGSRARRATAVGRPDRAGRVRGPSAPPGANSGRGGAERDLPTQPSDRAPLSHNYAPRRWDPRPHRGVSFRSLPFLPIEPPTFRPTKPQKVLSQESGEVCATGGGPVKQVPVPTGSGGARLSRT